jgi:hypothetical protein
MSLNSHLLVRIGTTVERNLARDPARRTDEFRSPAASQASMRDDEPLSLAALAMSAPFARVFVTVEPGRPRPYDAAEWRDALVVVETGALELECTAGVRRRFERGATLWFCGLPLRALHSPGPGPTLLVAVSRRPGPVPDQHEL